MVEQLSHWHVGIAAEAFAAGLFARCGYDVSVQYGANQPEYDLIVVKGDIILKVSVKGSQDGGWGLTQSFIKDAQYHKAADIWLTRHHKGTILCLVQFKGIALDQMPNVYLATPNEIAERLKASSKGRGETILYEHKVWTKRAYGSGTIDAIPDNWKFSEARINELFQSAGI